MNLPRLQRQLQFITEIDRLKSVVRRSYLVGGERRENSAEHSWHLAVAALVFAEHADAELDMLRVLKMLVLHDIVEIDADDTFLYDDARNRTKRDREQKAAARIFGLLPADQTQEFVGLWEEFERRTTPEAKFAAALDRLMPLIHNCCTEGRSWREHGVTRSQVLARNAHIGESSPALWEFVQTMIHEAVEKEHLPTS